MVSIGKIKRSHGARGELRLKLFASSELQLPLARIFVGKKGALREYKIEFLSPRGKIYHLKLEGVDSLAQADRLVGLEVFIPEDFLTSLEEDQFYAHQLEGCAVVTKAGEEIGRVVDLLNIQAYHLLVVERQGKEILIPFHKSICLEIDRDRKRILIDPPDGLLELNEI